MGQLFCRKTSPTMTSAVDFAAVQAAVDGDQVILDVRNKNEVESLGQIKGAHNVPLGDIDSAFDLDDEEFKSQYGFDKPGHEDEIITHCMRGGRAQNAADTLVAKGYTNVKVYPGSFLDWKAQGGEVVRPDSE